MKNENTRLNEIENSVFKNKHLYLMILLGLFIISLSSVSAFGNTLRETPIGDKLSKTIGSVEVDYNPLWEKYAPIEIKNNFDLPLISSTVFEGAIVEHTEYCMNNCYTIMQVNTYQDSPLVDNVSFYKNQGQDRRELNFNDYKFYVQDGTKSVEVEDYGYVCEDGHQVYGTPESASQIEGCEYTVIGTHSEDKPVWREYNIGEVMPSGSYTLKISGSLEGNDNLDWVITTQGQKVDNWATWTSSFNSGLQYYWGMDEKSGTNFIENISANNMTMYNASMLGGACQHGNCTTLGAVYSNATTKFPITSGGSTGEATISFWAKKTSAALYQDIMGIGGTGSQPFSSGEFQILFGGSGTTQGIRIDGTNSEEMIPNVDGTWRNYVYVIKNGQVVKGYRDGVNVGNSTGTVTWTNFASKNFSIFNSASGLALSTQMGLDEIAVWNRALSQSEITDLATGIYYSTISVGTVSLNSPNDGFTTTNNTVIFNCTASPQAARNLTNITLWTNSSGSFSPDTTILLNTNNQTNIAIQKTLDIGSTLWSCQACQNDSTCIMANSNRTVTNTVYVENSRIFNSNTYSGTIESYNLSFQTIPLDAISANLVYNGTNYATISTCSGLTCNLISSLAVPTFSLDSNVSFLWNITLYTSSFGNFNVITSSSNQSILNILIDNCTAYSNKLFNFSISDEDTLAPINGTIELFLQYFNSNNQKISMFNGTLKYVTGQSNSQICFSNITSGYITYQAKYYGNTSYYPQYNNVQNMQVNNNTALQNINLPDLLVASGYPFTLTIQGQDLGLLSGAIVDVQRQYLPQGSFISVEKPITDSSSNTIVHLILSSTLYNFIISKNGVVLGSFNNYFATCTSPGSTSCTQTLNLGQSTATITDFQDYGNISVSYNVNQANNTLFISFVSTDGNSHTVLANVLRNDGYGNTTICSNSITSTSGTLTCVVPQLYNQKSVYAEIYSDGVFVGRGFFNFGTNPQSVFYGTRIIFSVLLYSTLVLIMMINPMLIIIGSVLGILFSSLLLMVDGGSAFGIGAVIVWFIIAGGIILFYFNRKKF